MLIRTMSFGNYINRMLYLERKERSEYRKNAKVLMEARVKRATKFLLGGKNYG